MAVPPFRPPAIFNFVATLVALGMAVGLAWMAWLYYEYSPWTRDGRVRVDTVQVAPEVSGTVVSLPVKDLQYVHKGDLLFQIDQGTFRNDVAQAVGRLAEAKAQASYLNAEAERRLKLTDLSVSAEEKENAVGIAQGARDAITAATGALDQATLNLERTTVRSAVNGWVTDLLLQQGSFANAGRPAMTVVNADSFWVVGYFEETKLPRIKVGDEARLTLMAYPGYPIVGHVAGLNRGISVADAAPAVQGLPSVDPVFTWVRLAQRIPIRIELDSVPCPIMLAAGMTATVSILGVPFRESAQGNAKPPRSGQAAGQACDEAAVVP
jgi:multidrug resistance efflux pump